MNSWHGCVFNKSWEPKIICFNFQFNISLDNICRLCGNVIETHEDLFFDCLYSNQVLIAILEWLGIKWIAGIWFSGSIRLNADTSAQKWEDMSCIQLLQLSVTRYENLRVKHTGYRIQKVNRIENTITQLEIQNKL